MDNFRCEKCGSTNTSIEAKGTQTGLYCCDCGKWIKWLSNEEVRVFYSINKNESIKKCIVIETDFADVFELNMNKYLSRGYKVESSSCNSKLYKAILTLRED